MKYLDSYEITKKIGRKKVKGITQVIAKKVLDLLFQVLREEFENGAERVCFRDNLTLYVYEVPEKDYIHPRTREVIHHGKMRYLKVSLGKGLKSSVKREG